MSKVILVNVSTHEKRIAILENKILEEYSVERMEEERIVGNIYNGRVKTVIPGMDAAFIDIGLQKDGYLYMAGIEYESSIEDLLDLEEVRRPLMPRTIRPGEQILVQVSKGAIGTKGPRLTTDITLPARYMVLMPFSTQRGISKRIEGEEERKRLKNILHNLPVGPRMGVILRTLAVGKLYREVDRDAKYLVGMWKDIEDRTRRSTAPALVHRELDLTLRVIRDLVSEDFDEMWVDDKDEWKRIYDFLKEIVPNLKSRLKYYSDHQPLFTRYRLEGEIKKIFDPRVNLKCGGYIVIEQTEALLSIDINTGRFTGRRNLEDTARKTNMEAAVEIARQLRLRDVGGIVIIDFIDMNRAENRRKVFNILKEAMSKHKAKTNILRISELGLVEMTRQRARLSLEQALYETCTDCDNRGLVKTETTLVVDCLNRLSEMLHKSGGRKRVRITASADITRRLKNEDQKALKEIERRFRSRIEVEAHTGGKRDDVRIDLFN